MGGRQPDAQQASFSCRRGSRRVGGWQSDASQADLGCRSRCSAVLGAEGVGLSPRAAAACAGTCPGARARRPAGRGQDDGLLGTPGGSSGDWQTQDCPLAMGAIICMLLLMLCFPQSWLLQPVSSEPDRGRGLCGTVFCHVISVHAPQV